MRYLHPCNEPSSIQTRQVYNLFQDLWNKSLFFSKRFKWKNVFKNMVTKNWTSKVGLLANSVTVFSNPAKLTLLKLSFMISKTGYKIPLPLSPKTITWRLDNRVLAENTELLRSPLGQFNTQMKLHVRTMLPLGVAINID